MFPKIGVPQNGWFLMETPIKMDDLGVPLFSETSIYLHPWWGVSRSLPPSQEPGATTALQAAVAPSLLARVLMVAVGLTAMLYSELKLVARPVGFRREVWVSSSEKPGYTNWRKGFSCAGGWRCTAVTGLAPANAGPSKKIDPLTQIVTVEVSFPTMAK